MRVKLRKKLRLAIDTETTGLNRWTGCRPFFVSMCDVEGETRFWEWGVDPYTREVTVPEKERREVQLICGDTAIEKDLFNLKFDYLMLKSVGIELKGKLNEVSYMARAVNNIETNVRLKPLAKKLVGVGDADEKTLHATVVKCRRIAKKLGWMLAEDVQADYWLPHMLERLHPKLVKNAGIDTNVCREYAVQDAVRTVLLGAYYRHAMDDLGVRKVYDNEMELLPTTIEMEEIGICIDETRLKEQQVVCKKKIEDAHAVIVKASGIKDFNVNSSKQVVNLLFTGKPLKLPVIHRTKTNQPETGGEALLPHIGNPLVQAVLSYRANTKALATFFQKYDELATREPDGTYVLHPGYKQWGTLTSRYACSEPNLQAVSNPDTTSSRTKEFVVDVRQVFVPRPGKVWYCPDYSQVEVILFADIAGEPTMLEAIRNKVDIHESTANKVWGGHGNPKTFPGVSRLLHDSAAAELALKVLKLDQVGSKSKEYIVQALIDKFEWRIADLEKAIGKKIYRKLAKSVTFTKIFGGGPAALMSWIDVGHEEAKSILREYDSAFPDMMQKMRDIEMMGKENGYVIGPFGNRLAVDRWYAYRAVNHLVQNAAAMLMKNGMRKCAAYLKDLGLDARIGMTVHDELIFEFLREHAFKSVLRKICSLMSDHGGVFSVETPVDIDRVTERWSKKEKIKL